MIKCQICTKEFRSEYGLRSHVWRSHTEAGLKHDSNSGYKSGRKVWNKGLTKFEDIRLEKLGKKISQKQAGQHRDVQHSKEFLNNLSIRQSLHNVGGRCKWYEVSGQKVQGTYEKAFAERCDELSIKWKKCRVHADIFCYSLDGKEKHYTPDFYLPELQKFVEIKGFWWGRDREKIEAVLRQNPILKENFVILESLEQIQKFVGN